MLDCRHDDRPRVTEPHIGWPTGSLGSYFVLQEDELEGYFLNVAAQVSLGLCLDIVWQVCYPGFGGNIYGYPYCSY